MPNTYQAVARRFRPQNFHEIVGQEAIVKTLVNALSQDQVSHAYLFCGAKGTGKTSTARIFAKALLCPHKKKDQEPCNNCIYCQEVNKGQGLNLIEIDGASNRGIDDIRKINETLAYPPKEGSYRIFLIDEVHMLTKEAFNALLKNLEEPPPHVKFIFATTEVHKLPATILSRCQKFYFTKHSFVNVEKKLQTIARALNIELQQEAAALLASLSEGSLRDAEVLFDQVSSYASGPITAPQLQKMLGLADHNQLQLLDEQLQKRDIKKALEISESLFEAGSSYLSFTWSLIEHYQQSLRLGVLENKPGPSVQQLHQVIDLLLKAHTHMSQHGHERLYFEQALFKIMDTFSGIAIENLLQKLFDMEKQWKGSIPSPRPLKPQRSSKAPSISKTPPSSDEDWDQLHPPAATTTDKKKSLMNPSF